MGRTNDSSGYTPDDKLLIEIKTDGDPIKMWMSFEEYKRMNDWTKEREIKLAELIKHGRKRD